MIGSICEVPEVLKVMRIVNIVILIIRIIVPIILMISAMIDLVRAIQSGELNKITKPMVAKVIAAIIIFFIPVFVRTLADISGNDREYEKCLEDITMDTINLAYTTKEEDLVKKAEESKTVNDYNTALSYLINVKDEAKKADFQSRLDKVKEEIDKARKPVGPNGSTDPTNPSTPGQDSGELKIYYFGVGRFDAHLIIGNGTVLFIDSGYESQARKVIPYIKNTLGITKIDGLIGSHMHDNHIKGHIEFVKQMEIGQVIYAEDPGKCLSKRTCVRGSSNPTTLMSLVKQKNIPMTILKPGLNQTIGNLNFDVLEPLSFRSGTGGYPENYNSLNFILKFGNHKFYFSGDHVRSEEILKNYSKDTLDVDILKWPHHGQASVSNKLLDAMTPSYIIVPNSGHQSGSNSGIRYSKAKGLATGSDGYILAVSDGTNLKVTQVSKR